MRDYNKSNFNDNIIDSNRLSVDLAGLNFKNPVLVSSGTFGFGFEYADYFDPSILGGLVTKGITLKPRQGNSPPRLWETPAGVLNSIGLENPGVEGFIDDYLEKMNNSFSTNVIVNIAENSVEEYSEIASRLDDVKEKGIDALEVNISCPNVKQGGMAFGSSPDTANQVLKAVRKETNLPIIAKLSPNVTDPAEIAVAVEEAGCDAISLINTVLGMGIDVYTEKPVFNNVFAGLSGPAIKPIGVRIMWQVASKVNVPLIGMGGIMNYEDALEYMLAGASLVSIGVGNFVDPQIVPNIINDLDKHIEDRNYSSINELIGKARSI
ncbi:dihydroorotate dehydrogenase [Natranaerofaba carboxydovora]|uniref:dihydroorotate dehydrogenase n=1 Tax=Natranaerofaba carboxydovora TaxID=2742683 RepID=UPI001F144315|nr:dihydroorotate dehydrogenase [Natranaerofaba carboxydovora]UMZ73871.1 Dihydroorotate dehydrogenase B (NAD(+)), catalytic subunit [Natranaerofaba carboxydovora]